MYNCDEKNIIKLDADFNEDFDSTLIDLMLNCKRIYFLDQKGFGIKAYQTNSKFNKSVDILPSDITHIKFGYAFNHTVDNLPFRLEWLEFGYLFNQQVNMLPNGITYLVFGYSFNQAVFDLPNSLEYISFGKKFNYPIDSLPNSIYYINIGSIEKDYYNGIYNFTEFNQLTYNLPKKLDNIVMCRKNKKYPIKNDFINQLNKLILIC
jgi:hypothetical protein